MTKVLVTRPAAQADEWVARLQACDLDAVALPLIAIDSPPDAAAVATAWHGLAQQALVVFVSPNAAERFFAQRPPGAVWPPDTRAAAVGPGTAAALRAAGVAAAAIDMPAADAAQFDSESLWAVLGDAAWAGRRVLMARGDGGRDWLADRLREHGAAVAHVAVYRRAAPRLSAAQAAQLQAALRDPAAHLWFFSSSEAIDHLQGLVGAHDWQAAMALATHPRIADRARRLGIGRVLPCRPGFDDVVACIQSLAPSATP